MLSKVWEMLKAANYRDMFWLTIGGLFGPRLYQIADSGLDRLIRVAA